MPEKEKSLEMRVAEIEDKLAQMHITDEEMKTFNKVASAMGLTGGGEAMAGATAAGAAPGGPSTAARSIAVNRGLCRVRWNCWPCIIHNCICPCGPGFCNECNCGPCIQSGGGGGFGGGFGGFGG